MEITNDQWRSIDEAIFANLKLSAIQQIRAACGCSLGDAIEMLFKRYAELRTTSPNRFSCSEEDYWAGFYS
jgi:hypothetical protein